MMRRNNPTGPALPVVEFHYPSQDEIAAMVREAQQMRARAMRDAARRLWGLVTRRRPSAILEQSAAFKA